MDRPIRWRHYVGSITIDVDDSPHNRMMARARVIYNNVPWALGKQDLERNRVEIAQALVGQEMEKEAI